MAYNMKCKDYNIIKIRYYASDYLLKKWHATDGRMPKQHWDRAEACVALFWNIFEHVTTIKRLDWLDEYRFDARNCAQDELEEKYGIRIHNTEGSYVFFIPKSNPEIFQYIKNNCTLPYKVLTRARLGAFSYIRDLTWRRKEAKKFALKHLHNQINTE